MLIDFDSMEEVCIPNLNGGHGAVSAKMIVHKNGKIMLARIPEGASIGIHKHETSDDINYVISGTGKAVCDDREEKLSPGSATIVRKVRPTVLSIQARKIWFYLQ